MNFRLLRYELRDGIYKFFLIRIKSQRYYIIKKLLEILIIFILFPLSLFLYFLKYRQVKIYSERIGHQVIEYLYSLNFIDKYKLFILKDRKSANIHIYEYYKIVVISNEILIFLLEYIFIWTWLNINVEDVVRVNENNIYNLEFNNLHKFELNTQNLIDRKYLLDSLGINSSKYICIHVRGKGYSISDDIRFAYRNSNYDDLLLSIKYLKMLNFKIVIVGDKNNYDNLEVINYSNSRLKNSKNDILLISGCDYFIGNTSGLHLLAWVFNSKVLLLNMIPYSSIPFFNDIPFIRKDLVFNKLLTLDELEKIDNAYHDSIYEKYGVQYIDNSDIKILGFISNYIN